MSAISLKSITGITSITTPAGVDNQLTLHTNNTTERVRITSDGKLLVGRTSGSFALDVESASVNSFRISNSAETSHGSHDAKIVAGGTYYQNPTIVGREIKFRTFNTSATEGERVRISANGDVGIGYDSPNVKLHVREGSSSASSYDNRYHMICESSGEAYLGFYVPSNQYAGIRFTDNTGLEGYIDYYFGTDEMVYSSTSDHYWTTAGSQRLRIDSTGRVLIGTNNAGSIGSIDQNVVIGSTTNAEEVALTLNVMEGTNNRRVKFFLDDNDGVFGIDSTASTGVPPFVVRVAGTEKLRITSDGQVNIGGQYTQTVHTLSANSSNGSCIIIGNTSGTSSGSHDAQLVASHGSDFDNLKLTGHQVKVFANVSGGLGLSETWRFNSSGNLQCMISGKGIDFSANSNLAGKTGEVLDHYEIGTYVPTWSSATNPTSYRNGIDSGTTSNGLSYLRVGKQVTVTGSAFWSGNSINNARPFMSLPFPARTYSVSGTLSHYSLGVTTEIHYLNYNSSTQINFYVMDTSNSQHAAFGDNSGGEMYFNITYMTY